MKKYNKYNGFTLTELLVVSGLISVASIGIYGIYHLTNDLRKAQTEAKSLTSVINDIHNYGDLRGSLAGITLDNIKNYSNNYTPILELKSITSRNNDIKFSFENLNTRICNDFSGKMLSAEKNISANINNSNIGTNDFNMISVACSSEDGNNNVDIIYSRPTDYSAITTITASVNPPPPPALDVVVPATPTPALVPKVPAFIPTTANPTIYGITGSAPVYPFIPPSGGPTTITQGSSSGSTTIPGWTPPGFTPAPPAIGAPVDEIDQDVLPPIITTETRFVSCPTGYTGSITEARKKTVYQGSGNVTYTPWVETANSCILIPPPPPVSPYPCNEYKYHLGNFYGQTFNSTVENVAKTSGSACEMVPGYLAQQLIISDPSKAQWCMGDYSGRGTPNANSYLPSWVTKKEFIPGFCYSQNWSFIIYQPY